ISPPPAASINGPITSGSVKSRSRTESTTSGGGVGVAVGVLVAVGEDVTVIGGVVGDSVGASAESLQAAVMRARKATGARSSGERRGRMRIESSARQLP